MQAFAKFNGGIKFLLMVIDIFSKYGWIVPLKSKTGVEVAEAFKKIFKERRCDKIFVDFGKEFWNERVKGLNVELYKTENEEKSCVVERWNRTMKGKLFHYFTANSTRKYVDILDDMVDKYNNTRHSSIKMTPIEASKKKNEKLVWFNLYGSEPSYHQNKPKFKINDRVRITKKKAHFEKSYTSNWSEEIYTVSQVQFTDPPTYKIIDYNNDEIQGTFYEQELQKTRQEIFRIEKIIRRKGDKSLVKWLGYPETFNSWVDNKELISCNCRPIRLLN